MERMMCYEKTEYVRLNGFDFELSGNTPDIPENEKIRMADKNDIFKAYKRPSCYKTAIWSGWCDWAGAINENLDSKCGLRIRAYNSMTFSIDGYLSQVNQETGELEEYVLWITKEHNRAYRITF